MPKPLVLVIDDEKDILKLLQYNLEKEGYQTLAAKTGEEGLELAKSKKPSLIVLDLMLPGLDGLEVCKLLKNDPATKSTPVIMLTAKSSEVDQVVGLELGAVDYIAKPFSVKIFLARVKNALRQKAPAAAEPSSVIRAGDVTLDRERMLVTVAGKPVSLTKMEFNILAFLMQNKGKVFSRDRLLDGAWGSETYVIDRTVDVHVRSIRQKLGAQRNTIETVRGSGYRFVDG
jgi:two-component system phosphate regulon response regulator PhoB